MNSRKKDNPFLCGKNIDHGTDFELTNVSKGVFHDNISLIIDGIQIDNKRYEE